LFKSQTIRKQKLALEREMDAIQIGKSKENNVQKSIKEELFLIDGLTLP